MNKILIIHPRCYHKGGAEIVIINLVKHLWKKGVAEPVILTGGMPLEVEQELEGTDILVPRKTLLTPNINAVLREYLHFRIDDFDVINPHTPFSELYLFPKRKASVWMCNELPAKLLFNQEITKEEKMMVQTSISSIVVSDNYNARRIEETYGMKPFVNPYGIDTEYFKKPRNKEILSKYKVKEDGFILLHPGHIQQFKNQLRSVEIAGALREKIPNLQLLLAGWDKFPYCEEVRQLIGINKLDDTVKILGNVPRGDLRDLYHASNVILFPYKKQGGWLSFLEALATKKPTLVGEDMLATDLVRKEGLGVVTNDFESEILKIHENPSIYTEQGDRGFKWVKENATWEKFGDGMVKAYEQALNRYE